VGRAGDRPARAYRVSPRPRRRSLAGRVGRGSGGAGGGLASGRPDWPPQPRRASPRRAGGRATHSRELGVAGEARSARSPPLHRAHRFDHRHRLCGGGRPEGGASGAGAVRARRPSHPGGRTRTPDPGAHLARAPADPGDQGPAGFLARLLGRGEEGDAGALSSPPLARRPSRGEPNPSPRKSSRLWPPKGSGCPPARAWGFSR
jgi:hypothetical protein